MKPKPALPLPPTLEQEVCLALLHAQRPEIATHPIEGPTADRIWRNLLFEWAWKNGLEDYLLTDAQRTLADRWIGWARAELAESRGGAT